MRDKSFYTAETIAGGAILLLGVALIWVGLAGPEADQEIPTNGIFWAVASLLLLVEGLRKKPLISINHEGKAWFMWLMLITSLVVFVSVLRGVVEADALGLALILRMLIFLVLALLFLYGAIVTRREIHAAQQD